MTSDRLTPEREAFAKAARAFVDEFWDGKYGNRRFPDYADWRDFWDDHLRAERDAAEQAALERAAQECWLRMPTKGISEEAAVAINAALNELQERVLSLAANPNALKLALAKARLEEATWWNFESSFGCAHTPPLSECTFCQRISMLRAQIAALEAAAQPKE